MRIQFLLRLPGANPVILLFIGALPALLRRQSRNDFDSHGWPTATSGTA
jgi:hypothetical protein